MNRIPCYDKEGNTIKSLIQWDKNQSVYIDDLENGSLPRVHFALGSNAKESKEYKDNVKFDGKKIKITIPNELLKTYAEMYLFLYYGDVESEEPLTTKYMVKIPITKKPQPDDYIYEDNVDYLSIYKLKLELSLILDNAANYAAESRANKESAETAAREAAGSAQEARNILSDVNSAGANQIQAIETAGAEQTDAAKAEIDAKGKQTLDSIPEDYTGLQTEVDGLKGDLVNSKKAISELDNKKITKFYASNIGNTNLQDSDSGKITDMMLYGKSEQKKIDGNNLANCTLDSKIVNGITITKKDDGTYTLNGTCESAFNIVLQDIVEFDDFDIGESYVFDTHNTNNIASMIQTTDDGTDSYYSSGSPFVFTDTITRIRLFIGLSAGTFNNALIQPMLNKGTDVLPYEPYTGGIPSPNPDYPQEIKSVVNPVVKVIGGNLINPGSGQESIKNRGITFTINSDKSITINGTNDGSGYSAILLNSIEYFEIGDIISTGLYGDKEDGNIYLDCYFIGDIYLNRKVESKKVDNNLTHKVFLCVKNGATVDNVTVKAMRNYGATLFPYEPYKEQTVTLPYTLNAIPVSSGGNVTIDGQEYIADYVDVERKKLVRRIKTINSPTFEDHIEDSAYGQYCSLTLNDKGIENTEVTVYTRKFKGISAQKITTIDGYRIYCGNNGDKIFIRFPIGEFHKYNEVASIFSNEEIIYQLATPTEIDLTDEEVQAFKDLATYYPVTNVFVTSDKLDGYAEFNYPLNMKNGWDYVMEKLGDTREYIYDMELQSAEAYVNSEYAVTLTELGV